MPTTLKDARERLARLSREALDVVEASDLTAAEKHARLFGPDGAAGLDADVKAAGKECRDLEELETKRAEFARTLGAVPGPVPAAGADDTGGTVGEQFVRSNAYKDFVGRKSAGALPSTWSTGVIETKTTLSEGTSGSPGPGYYPANIPQVLPGVTDIRFMPLTVADLFAQGATQSPLIWYLKETTATNAAAGTAEGGSYAESALAFEKDSEVLAKIATFLPVTDEMLEDWDQVRTYIDARLALFVGIAEEVNILSGDGSGYGLTGILARSGLATTIVKGTSPSLTGDYDHDVVYRQVTAIRSTAFLEPDALVMHPTDWQTIVLTRSSQGIYYAGGPFATNDARKSIWGFPVVTTTRIPQGTCLVGAFKQAGMVVRKGGITLEASNSHSDYFVKGTTAIRAEERLALVVFRPGAFGKVTGL